LLVTIPVNGVEDYLCAEEVCLRTLPRLSSMELQRASTPKEEDLLVCLLQD
jgi:hypothetical protein